MLKSKKILIIGGIGVILLLILVGAFLFLVDSEPQVNTVTQQAQEALNANDTKKGYEILKKGAESNQLDQQGQALYSDLKKQIFANSLKIATDAEDNNDYRAAYEAYQLVLDTAPEGEDITEYRDALTKVEALMIEQEKLQNQLNKYMDTFIVVIDDSNDLLIEYKRFLDSVQTGKMTAEQFVDNIKNKISISTQISTMLDDALYMENDELLNVHKTLISNIQFQHNMFLQSLELTEENKKAMLEQFNQQYLKIKQDQVSMIQTLNSFAKENQLKSKLDKNKE